MLGKIFRAASFFILSVVLIPSIVFFGQSSVDALSEEASGNNPLQIVIERADEDTEMDDKSKAIFNKSERPNLGDDQVFPFVAGLDSYEGS